MVKVNIKKESTTKENETPLDQHCHCDRCREFHSDCECWDNKDWTKVN